ncbi:MAG: AMP-binding protein [Spirochaetota bacterium]|nr:AMP-binding protein [Spirochaetota bacterium]
MIKEILGSNARRYPERTAIVYKDKRYTFEELDNRTNRLANALIDLGLKKGDWIAIVADDCIEHIEIFWAGAKTGIITTGLNPSLSEKDYLHHIGNGKASAVVCSNKYRDKIDSQRSKFENLKNYILLDDQIKDYRNYEELIFSYPSKKPNVQIDDNDLLYFANTSGTTGLSKQVMHTYKSIFSTTIMDLDAMNYDMRAGGVNLVAGPLFWGYMIPRVSVLCYHMGCTLVLPENLSPQILLQSIEEGKVTNMVTGTAFLQQIMEYKEIDKYDISSLRQIFIFGYFPPEIWQKAIKIFGNIFVLAYGSSEFGIISFLPPEDFIFEGPQKKVNRVRSCGREALCVKARVIDDNGEDVVPGELGEVIAKGDDMMKGYWNAPEATAGTIKDGYIYTGDMGTVDEDGYIYLAGRKKDTITTDGKTILPLEVEEIILLHPKVNEVTVIGIPDERLGEAVKAVVIAEQEDITSDEIIELCKDNLPDFAVPGSVDFVDRFPKTASGRVQRFKLREQYI